MPDITAFPSFPKDVPTHPLLIVDYQLLLKNDVDEVNKLWKTAIELGFWYLKNHDTDEEFEKMKFEQGDEGMSHGYKATGTNATGATGAKDTVEWINIAQDDVLAWPEVIYRTYPSSVNARMQSTINLFVKRCLANLHLTSEPCSSEARCIKNPPFPEQRAQDPKIAVGEHTDFSSLSILHNVLGELLVLPPGYTKWQYVKPTPGHATCNVGDTPSIFSGGVLRSHLHRVLPPPREQSKFERWSLVFFSRPNSSVLLLALAQESKVIEDAVIRAPNPEAFNPNSSAGDWFARRTRNRKVKNRTGPETWASSRGTEHTLLTK